MHTKCMSLALRVTILLRCVTKTKTPQKTGFTIIYLVYYLEKIIIIKLNICYLNIFIKLAKEFNIHLSHSAMKDQIQALKSH